MTELYSQRFVEPCESYVQGVA